MKYFLKLSRQTSLPTKVIAIVTAISILHVICRCCSCLKSLPLTVIIKEIVEVECIVDNHFPVNSFLLHLPDTGEMASDHLDELSMRMAIDVSKVVCGMQAKWYCNIWLNNVIKVNHLRFPPVGLSLHFFVFLDELANHNYTSHISRCTREIFLTSLFHNHTLGFFIPFWDGTKNRVFPPSELTSTLKKCSGRGGVMSCITIL